MKIWQLFENFNLAELNANFAELLASVNGAKATYLTANKSVYVATTGNDTTGDGTSGNPYKTIAKGLSVIPKNLNGYDATLYIAGGTYAESVLIRGFHGGILLVAFSGNVTINSILIYSTQFAYIYGSSSMIMTLISTASNPITVSNKSSLFMPSSISTIINTSTARTGMFVAEDSNANVLGTMTVNNANYALRAASSKVFVGTLAGSGNNYSIVGTEGASISYGTKTISATTDHVLTGGSIITNDLLSNTATQWNE